MKSSRTCILGFICAIGPFVFAQSGFKEELNLGVQAHREARYEEAVRHFQNATALEPANETAHLYLATALGEQYIPGVDTVDNIRLADAGIREYEKALEINSKSPNAVKGVAYLYLQMKKFDDAKSYYRRSIDLEPDDPEPYYSVAVIDWTLPYTRRMELREKLALKADEPLPTDAPDCWELRDSNLSIVNEGMEMLSRALDRRRDYDDATAYMNLLYRERADIQCNDTVSRSKDLTAADHWVDLTIQTKKKNNEKAMANRPERAK
jgi:tetratricopeptide (TPR) repeat protein